MSSLRLRCKTFHQPGPRLTRILPGHPRKTQPYLAANFWIFTASGIERHGLPIPALYRSVADDANKYAVAPAAFDIPRAPQTGVNRFSHHDLLTPRGPTRGRTCVCPCQWRDRKKRHQAESVEWTLDRCVGDDAAAYGAGEFAACAICTFGA
jgi:hypothetical protein